MSNTTATESPKGKETNEVIEALMEMMGIPIPSTYRGFCPQKDLFLQKAAIAAAAVIFSNSKETDAPFWTMAERMLDTIDANFRAVGGESADGLNESERITLVAYFALIYSDMATQHNNPSWTSVGYTTVQKAMALAKEKLGKSVFEWSDHDEIAILLTAQ